MPGSSFWGCGPDQGFRYYRGWGWGFVVLSVLAAGLCAVLWARAYATRSWPSAEGRVTGSSIVDERTRGARGRVDVQHRVGLYVDYQVDGRHYTAWKTRRFELRSSAEEFQAEHAHETILPVYYDPADPSSTVLERGLSIWSLLGGGFLIVGLAAGSVLSFGRARSLRPAP